jgi:dCTP deaminase
MALSDKKILYHKRAGNIVIEPYNRRHLATSSYDVTLGENYFREQTTDSRTYNIWDEAETKKVWGKLQIAWQAKDVLAWNGRSWPWRNIQQTNQVIILRPGETILGHTQEFIGGRNCVTTMMKARSSMGRNFIEVCKCAGWGDVGFFNRWTMEITNISHTHSIPLVVGRRIAQIVFFETGPIIERDYTKSGKYQSGGTVDELMASWVPEMMLPRLHRDREVRQRRKK